MTHTNSSDLTLTQPVSVWNKTVSIQPKALFVQLAKAAASGASGNFQGASQSLADSIQSVGLKDDAGQVAWLLVYQSLMQTLQELIDDYNDFFKPLEGCTAEELADPLEAALNKIKVCLDARFFERPQDLELLETLKPALMFWLQQLGMAQEESDAFHRRLKDRFVLSLHAQWLKKPEVYAPVQQALESPFTQANQQERSWMQYQMWLQEQTHERMFNEAFSLSQVYVPLRAYYFHKPEECDDSMQSHERHGEQARTKEKPKKMVVDLQEDLNHWVQNFDKQNAVRVISGGPGCGKSSFGKIFAAHVVATLDIKVLFIPLHHFDPSDDLIRAVEKFASLDRFLSGSPLDSSDGHKRLLLIFDGLDELSMQGKAAAEIAQSFVQEVVNKINHFNLQGLQRQALLTGRDLAVQAGASLLRGKAQVLHILPYLLDEEEQKGYQDSKKLLPDDQRHLWWQNYGKAKGKDYESMPEALQQESLTPITREPLLNYLVALSFERNVLDFDQQTTLNEVYADLLESVYKRQWEGGRQHQGAANVEWAKLCGPTTMDDYLFEFLKNEIALKPAETAEAWQKIFAGLLGSTVRQTMPMEKLGLSTFQEMQKQARNSGEALLAAHYACARQTQKVSQIDWGEKTAFGVWIKQIQGQRTGARNSLGLGCLGFLDLSECVLYNLDFFGANLEKSMISELILSILLEANLRNADLQGANFRNANLRGGNLPEANLQGADLQGANLRDANLRDANLRNSNLRNTNLQEANLRNTNLRNTKLEGANLQDAKLEGANLHKAKLHKANLEYAKLQDAKLQRAILQGAKLQDANLQKADLQDANLQDANLQDANLKEANLKDAKLKNVEAEGAILPRSYVWKNGDIVKLKR